MSFHGHPPLLRGTHLSQFEFTVPASVLNGVHFFLPVSRMEKKQRVLSRNATTCFVYLSFFLCLCPPPSTYEDVHSIEGFKEWHSDKYPYPSCSLCLLPEPNRTTLHHTATCTTLHRTRLAPCVCFLNRSPRNILGSSRSLFRGTHLSQLGCAAPARVLDVVHIRRV